MVSHKSMPYYIAALTSKLLNRPNAQIALFGLAYKDNVNDFRNSPALVIRETLISMGFSISVFDPHIPNLSCDVTSAVRVADLILILTDHDEFKCLDYKQLGMLMKNPLMFDTRNILTYHMHSLEGCKLIIWEMEMKFGTNETTRVQ